MERMGTVNVGYNNETWNEMDFLLHLKNALFLHAVYSSVRMGLTFS